ncbi:MAG: metallophosphoesterase [Kiritimatiellaeota bacterium]|nr:metallophosphoesterase [Kiritimatiellota bacterium]
MIDSSLTILAVADLHFTGLARQVAQPTHMHGGLARILFNKVFLRLKHLGIKPDVTVVLGDVLEDGTDPNADADLIALHSELTRSGIPFLMVRGNHDTQNEHFAECFDVSTKLHTIGGYGFIVYDDIFAVTQETTREESALAATLDIANDNPNLPLIALQHAPVYPAIDSHYPYRPTNTAEIIGSFRKAGVFLSLSGHYHKGQKVRASHHVFYHTVPALCEAPFPFSIIRLKGKKVEVEEHALALHYPNLTDVHCHTEYAYCATTVNTATAIALSTHLGVTKHCVLEHSFQLYFEKRYAMSGKWQSDPQRVEAVWATPERSRMANYRRFAEKLRSPFVKIGLEIDLYDNGKILLAPEDAEEGFWDILIGAIHFIHDFVPGQTTQQEAEKMFIRDVTQLVLLPIKVLAHPFRFFAWNNLETPKHLYPVVANLLADSGVAAEVNFHAYRTDPDFIRCCVEKNVKIALASDAHALQEVGELAPHVEALRMAGVTPKMFPDVLFSFDS